MEDNRQSITIRVALDDFTEKGKQQVVDQLSLREVSVTKDGIAIGYTVPKSLHEDHFQQAESQQEYLGR